MSRSENRGLFSVLPQDYSVLFLATVCCKLTVICLFDPPVGSARGLGVAFCSLLHPSMGNTAGHPVGITWSRSGERRGPEVGSNEVPCGVIPVLWLGCMRTRACL